MIRQWLKNRQIKRDALRHQEGYNYAAGYMLSYGSHWKQAADELAAMVSIADKTKSGAAFDMGIINATSDFYLLKRMIQRDRYSFNK